MLEVRHLHVWFQPPRGRRLHAVADVSFELQTGERLGLVGESGCGKSTVMLAIMGLLPPNATVAGQILLDGEEILTARDDAIRSHRWSDIAMVFQGTMNAFNPVRRVGAQIVEPMELHGTASGAAAHRRVAELLQLVGLPAVTARRYPHELSGGMRQRVAIAMALACDPKILLADEPTTALDVIVQAQVLELLVKLSDDAGLALMLVTHDLPVVAEVCQRAAVMYGGELVETGRLATLHDSPQHHFTRLLFASTLDLEVPDAPRPAVGPISSSPIRISER